MGEQSAQRPSGALVTPLNSIAPPSSPPFKRRLNALEQDADALNAAAAAETAAQNALSLTERQWRAGYGSYLALLNTEQTYQQALSNIVQAQANRYTDTAALFPGIRRGLVEPRGHRKKTEPGARFAAAAAIPAHGLRGSTRCSLR
jgi:hypothetical protein